MMKIIKTSGEIVDFDATKLKKSLTKSGATDRVVDAIFETIQNQAYDGITTKQIYKMAFALLKKASHSHAARYNLRTSIQMLGPAGFFFEKYIARLYESEGYTTLNNITLQGKCVSHEIDVVIKKLGEIAIAECKFHAKNELVSDVKVPMYILSRFNDLKDRKQNIFTRNDMISKCFIVTNNRFSSDAILFANCSGLKILSWDYPKEDNLKNKIDQKALYPVTCLTTLTAAEKEKLLILGIIIASELINNTRSLEKIGLSRNRMKNVLREVSELCNIL